jgi:thiamine kinase-like enzyme
VKQFDLSTEILPYPGTNIIHYYIKRFVEWPYPLSWLLDNVNKKSIGLLKKLKKTKIKCGLCKMDPDPTNFLIKDDRVNSIDWQTLFHSDPLLEVGYLLSHMEAKYTGYPSKGSRLFQKNLLKRVIDSDIFGKNIENRIRMGLINGISAPIKRSYMQKDVDGFKYYNKRLKNFLKTDMDELFLYTYK